MKTRLSILLLFPCCLTFCTSPALAGTGDWQAADGPLKTRWAKEVSPQNALPDYPRPQMVRNVWLNLNGLWDYAVTEKDAARPEEFHGKILVPFPIESALSGVMKRVTEKERIWYKRTFDLPRKWIGQRVLLHFGAVDFEATVYVNGRQIGTHHGGYDGFSFDITDSLYPVNVNEIVVAVWDPTDAGTQPRGKQVRKPGGIWYTPTSGIWQTVWLEPVSAAHIVALKITPDVDQGCIIVRAQTPVALGEHHLKITVRDSLGTKASGSGRPGTDIRIPIKHARLWSPESPHLYQLTASLQIGSHSVDRVESYFGMRKISLGKDDKGFTRMLLNNKPYFQIGPLDQGFWPDGIYTAPTDDALRYDIEMTKKLGFNMARKHVKIEPERWYYWCDKLGLIVWQDMPSGDKYIGGRDPDITRSPESAAEYEQELTALIEGRGNHPCIVMWVPYNEGWGQWDTARMVQKIKHLDPARLVDNASGWTDRHVGDVNDMHKYPGPASPEPEQQRAAVLGEFGGLGLPLHGHTWQGEKNWGYKSFTDTNTLTTAYLDLISKLYPLIEEKGLSAAVYTQTTDVEVEVNGLMTYDREVVKMDIAKIAAANRGKVPARARVTELVPTAQTGRVSWRFTLDQPPVNWFKPEFDASSWKQSNGGFGTQGTPGAVVRTDWTTSDIWLRRDFSLPHGPDSNLHLLMHHDEDAQVYLNGILAANPSGYTTDYEQFDLSPPAKASLKTDQNVMAVHCHQTTGGQFIDVGLVSINPAKN